ncbi:hypothetical protein MAAFP003_1242 [Mycobacterium ahvazicum]|uniref:Uncharacterized protein n=1 Tax=Mycobacterium ahvazicum TaxID=1964395 RepID=A0A2K4Y716_9MYCO|nr:hypothetical protein MAAFP003_1242 [Mycobacterium ahvazicum]
MSRARSLRSLSANSATAVVQINNSVMTNGGSNSATAAKCKKPGPKPRYELKQVNT